MLTARNPGTDGGNITLTVATSTSATVTATSSGATLNIYLENPSQIAPGTVIEVNGVKLCDSTASADFTQAFLPTSLNGCTVYVDGVPAPLFFVSPTQINVQMMNEAQDRTSISLVVRNQHADGSVTVTTPVAATIVPQNPGLFAQPGKDPRKGIIYHGSSSAFDLIGVDGTIQAGDVATITINGTAYNYTVTATDTLATVRDALIAAINSAPDPNVHASVANEYFRIALTANAPGPQGEGITRGCNGDHRDHQYGGRGAAADCLQSNAVLFERGRSTGKRGQSRCAGRTSLYFCDRAWRHQSAG